MDKKKRIRRLENSLAMYNSEAKNTGHWDAISLTRFHMNVGKVKAEIACLKEADGDPIDPCQLRLF